MTDTKSHSPHGLENHGLCNLGPVHWNLNQAQLTEHAIRKGEGSISVAGSLVVKTGSHTGRSANDKFVVRDQNTENEIWWGCTSVSSNASIGMRPRRVCGWFSDVRVCAKKPRRWALLINEKHTRSSLAKTKCWLKPNEPPLVGKKHVKREVAVDNQIRMLTPCQVEATDRLVGWRRRPRTRATATRVEVCSSTRVG